MVLIYIYLYISNTTIIERLWGAYIETKMVRAASFSFYLNIVLMCVSIFLIELRKLSKTLTNFKVNIFYFKLNLTKFNFKLNLNIQ